jgi:gamma-glutamylcyclotransferase (GGCT)/AIG2-like uncharacterized protein YtfP
VASEPTRLLFVYGTLQRGGIWHHLLAREEFVGRDTVTGALYLHPCGAYPVLLPGDRTVPGEVFRVGPAAFERVARLEAGEYTPRDVMTGAGRSVTVFVCEDDRFRTPSRALESFDPTR